MKKIEIDEMLGLKRIEIDPCPNCHDKRYSYYDENDNFRNKLWVLTSYDASRKEEDKLRKVVSEETAFKKEVNSSSPLQYSLEKGVTLSTFSPDSLSQPKDTTNINIEQ